MRYRRSSSCRAGSNTEELVGVTHVDFGVRRVDGAVAGAAAVRHNARRSSGHAGECPFDDSYAGDPRFQIEEHLHEDSGPGGGVAAVVATFGATSAIALRKHMWTIAHVSTLGILTVVRGEREAIRSP